jgi:hypothetical protein
MKPIVLLLLFLSACTHQSRWPSQAAHEPATWDEAMRICKERNAHVPTAREYVNKLKPLGIEVLEKNEVKDKAPEGFYLVDSINPDGQRDTFYMSHAKYQRPADLKAPFRKLWTSSTPPTHQDFAHVFYEEWGGGGGEPKEHHKKFRNAFECLPN